MGVERDVLTRSVVLRVKEARRPHSYPELRRALERSQTDLAAALGISQSAVSQLERGEDVKLSTLRSYVHGLGAHLQIVAVFDDGEKETEIPIRLGAEDDETTR